MEPIGIAAGEARISHLAYSSGIAGIMLRKQAARAVRPDTDPLYRLTAWCLRAQLRPPTVIAVLSSGVTRSANGAPPLSLSRTRQRLYPGSFRTPAPVAIPCLRSGSSHKPKYLFRLWGTGTSSAESPTQDAAPPIGLRMVERSSCIAGACYPNRTADADPGTC
jgi:hypothetical protein